MIATAKDLRLNIAMLFDVLNRGKAKAKLMPFNDSNNFKKSDEMFGMLKDETDSIDDYMINLRKGRNFDI